MHECRAGRPRPRVRPAGPAVRPAGERVRRRLHRRPAGPGRGRGRAGAHRRRACATRRGRCCGELDAAGLPADRTEFLRGQLTGLECSARKMSGEPVAFRDEVRSYFQVDVELGDPTTTRPRTPSSRSCCPGDGTLAERYARHRRREECPPQRLEVAVQALSSALRDRVRTGYGLPEAETVRYEVVTDKPWSGFNYYEGAYRSRVAINADLPHRLSQLPHLVAHESYPGPPHRALPQGAGPGRARRPRRAHRLPGQHPRVPDGRGAGRPGRAGLGRRRAGGRGPPRCSATWACGSTAPSPSGSRRRPRR